MKYVLVNLIKSLTFSVERKNLINKERLTPEGIFPCLQCFSWSVYKSHPLNRLRSSLKIPATLQAWRAKPSTRQSKSLYFRNDLLRMNGIWIDWCVHCMYFCKAFIIFCHLHNNRENAGCLLQNFHMMIFLFKHVDNLKLNRLIGTIVWKVL